jgi:hypothetical protein
LRNPLMQNLIIQMSYPANLVCVCEKLREAMGCSYARSECAEWWDWCADLDTLALRSRQHTTTVPPSIRPSVATFSVTSYTPYSTPAGAKQVAFGAPHACPVRPDCWTVVVCIQLHTHLDQRGTSQSEWKGTGRGRWRQTQYSTKRRHLWCDEPHPVFDPAAPLSRRATPAFDPASPFACGDTPPECEAGGFRCAARLPSRTARPSSLCPPMHPAAREFEEHAVLSRHWGGGVASSTVPDPASPTRPSALDPQSAQRRRLLVAVHLLSVKQGASGAPHASRLVSAKSSSSFHP